MIYGEKVTDETSGFLFLSQVLVRPLVSSALASFSEISCDALCSGNCCFGVSHDKGSEDFPVNNKH